MSDDDYIQAGDIVAVHHGSRGRKEGLVVGSHVDYAGRTILEVQLEPGDIYNYWYPSVTRVRRTISYRRPSLGAPKTTRTIERRVIW